MSHHPTKIVIRLLPKNPFTTSIRQVVLLFFFIVVFSFVTFVRPITVTNETNVLSAELKNFIVPNVYIGKVEYIVDQGNVTRADGHTVSPSQRVHVLKIAYASVITRVNPLFSFEGANPENLYASSKVLEKSLKSLQKFYSPEEQSILESGFYPIELVRSIARAEEARNTLVKNPSARVLRAYIKDTRESLSAFHAYAKDVQNMYKRALPKDSKWRYNFVGGRTTRANVLLFTNQVKDDIGKLAQKFEDRIHCIQNISRTCKKLTPEFQFEENIGRNIREPKIPKNVAFNRKTLADAYTILPSFINESAEELPFLIENPYCFPEKNSAFYSLLQETYDGELLTKTLTLDDLYFYGTYETDAPYLEKAFLEGFDYLYQPPTNTYVCPLDVWDSARMLTMRMIRTKLLMNPIFANNSSHTWEELKNKEISITNTSVVHSIEIDTYMRALRELLKPGSGDYSLAKEIGEEKIYAIESLLNIYNAQSASVSELLVVLVSENTFVLRSFQKDVPIKIDELAISRSSPLLGLFTFNGSLYSELPRFIVRNTTDFASFKFTTYREDVELRAQVSVKNLPGLIKKTLTRERALK